MINNIFSICQTISQEMHNNNYTNAYNEFVNLLDSIISFRNQEMNGKVYSDDDIAIVLLSLKGFNPDNYSKAIEPLKIHLYTLGKFAEKLKAEINIQYAERYKTLFLDVMTDTQNVLSVYEYVNALGKYKQQLGRFKACGGTEPTNPKIRTVNIGRNPNINLFDRRTMINSVFWLEQYPDIKDLPFRDLRPHAAILIRQALEIMWRDAIGYCRIRNQNGDTLKQFTQIGWKFINQYRTKDKNTCKAAGTQNLWSITTPVPIKTFEMLNNWCNNFTHDPWIYSIHVQWFVTEQLWRVTQPATYNGNWTSQHGDIRITGLKYMQSEFEQYVARENNKAFVDWPTNRKPSGAFVVSEGAEPTSKNIRAFRLKQTIINLCHLITELSNECISFFKLMFCKQ